MLSTFYLPPYGGYNKIIARQKRPVKLKTKFKLLEFLLPFPLLTNKKSCQGIKLY